MHANVHPIPWLVSYSSTRGFAPNSARSSHKRVLLSCTCGLGPHLPCSLPSGGSCEGIAKVLKHFPLARTLTFRALLRSATTGMTTNASSPANALSAGSSQPAIGLDADNPTFITTWTCPYAQRTWIVLNEKGVKYDPVYVDLVNKPEWFLQHNPYGRVPTLVWQDNSSTTR